MECSAEISECGTYRYTLTRKWGEGRKCVFIMLNPSTADATKDDRTIRRCIGFAKREGCGSLTVVNLYAYRATKLPAFWKFPNCWKEGKYVSDIIENNPDALFIAAWGSKIEDHREDEMLAKFYMTPLYALRLLKYDRPGHPLYVRADAPLLPYNKWAK